MTFEVPAYLALLALAPLAGVAYVAVARWRESAARRFAPGRELERPSERMRFVKAGLVVLAVALLAVAMARPQIGEEHVLIEQEGADVVLVLDVSRSMLASDAEPTRLDVATAQARLLVERLRGHRVGLVVFAGTAIVRAPLTTDTEPLDALLASAVEDGALVDPGSDLGGAIRTAMGVLRDRETATRVIVLISDGEDHSGDALAAAEAVAGNGISIYASGAGTMTGAAVPAEFENGVPVVTRLDENLLRSMSVTTPTGRYASVEQLATIGDEINSLERSLLESDREQLPVERFQWLVLVALGLLVAERLLPDRGWSIQLRLPRRVLRPAAATALLSLFVLAGPSCSSAADDLLDEGNDAYRDVQYEEALETYRQAGSESPDRSEPHYNAGLALHRLARFDEAASETLRALPLEEPQDAAAAYYNLGLHYAEMGRLDDAANALRQSLLLRHDDADAKFNLELVRRLQEQEEAQAQRPQPGNEESEGGEPPDPGGGATAGQQTEEALRQELRAAIAGGADELTIDEALLALELAQELNSRLPVTNRERQGSADLPDW